MTTDYETFDCTGVLAYTRICLSTNDEQGYLHKPLAAVIETASLIIVDILNRLQAIMSFECF